MTETSQPARPVAFAIVYVAATFGALLCFIPLIGLILPQRVAEIVPDDSITAMSRILLAGGIASSVCNIAGGWTSDRLLLRQGSRMPMVGAGMVATLASFAAMGSAGTIGALSWAFVAFQIAFNLLFAPLVALASDHVIDAHKGRLFGMLSLAMPAAQGVTTLIALSDIEGIAARLAAVGLAILLLLAPLIAFGQRYAGPQIEARQQPPHSDERHRGVRLGGNFAYAWMSRFLIQCGGVAVSAYLLLHLRALAADADTALAVDAIYGKIMAYSLLGAIVIGPIVGFLSDRSGRRLTFLLCAIMLVAVGCTMIAASTSWQGVALGYGLFAIGMSGFLTLDGAIIAQIVGQGDARGAQLGILNLTNTLPAILVPGMLIGLGGTVETTTTTLFWIIAGAALLGLACATRIGPIR